ncbi:MAG: RNA 2',3'-cyclic phosphodiesterase [Nitrospira sp.]|nr:RNA 2',3'-cyclic phosphodiesterase [Nitrospira sp.]MDH4368350.1 RNA 2',3'-cyclic phosphodiesterase [Nitrospira sp.]MDH5348283.1 RNA 2',3'-cyclic phosphodiesterase [Nitrospira sp.]MDH5496237.1 RNA 2',3'-cyclic phosphodiesterase [Nitrospira sp.]MDH5724314.1 RNA 2',3'-cyclic phosphodiesterase [Nitrospira sp.]
MIRTFLAVEVSNEIGTGIAQVQDDLKQRLAGHLPKEIRMAWGQPNSFHLTIRFLGNTDKHLLDPMREAMAIVRRAHPTIQTPLDRLQAFPNLQKPRVLWVGPSEQWCKSDAARQLAALHQGIEACCHSFGFAPDDKLFNPHLTLARIKAGEREVGQWLAQSGVCDQPLSLGEVRIGPLVLVKSTLRPTGPVYTKLWEVE